MEYEEEDEGDYDANQADYPVASGLSPCSCCGRSFNPTALSRHEIACRKSQDKAKKRGVFDASKKRIQAMGLNPAAVEAAIVKNDKALEKAEAKKAQWRQKHETFIKTIREARKVQDIIDKGGSLADLPPPPRDEHPEYVQCPHCGRRFNETVADRHVPWCATQAKRIPSKKPTASTPLKKPAPQGVGGGGGGGTPSARPLSAAHSNSASSLRPGQANTAQGRGRPGSASKAVPVANLRPGQQQQQQQPGAIRGQTGVPTSANRQPIPGISSKPPPTATNGIRQPTPPMSRKPPAAPTSTTKRASFVDVDTNNNYNNYNNSMSPFEDRPISNQGPPLRTGGPRPVERSTSGNSIQRSSVVENGNFCGNCGSECPARVHNYCVECGCKYAERARFCGECGARRKL